MADTEADTRRRVSLADVAARAGVSTATASRSLRGETKVSEETRHKVAVAARELAYVRTNYDDQSQVRSTIGLIVPFIDRWFFATATGAAIDYLRTHGYDVLLYHVGRPDIRDRFFQDVPLAGRVDGILSVSMPLTAEHTLSLRALSLPIVSIGSEIAGSPCVRIDDFRAAQAAVNHLLNLRHERIGLITGRADDPRFEFTTSMGRRLGYEESLNTAGVEFDSALVVEGAHGIDGGAAAMSSLLAQPRLPTAILAEYDELAIGALWALRRAGLRVPEDISVIGIDDHQMAGYLDLTTVAQDVNKQARLAAQMLLQLLGAETGEPPAEPVFVPTNLILRNSTAPPRSLSNDSGV